MFERKNYFYPDLPNGYQITQYEHPIVGHGHLLIDLPDGHTKPIGITRLHLEMDAGKSLHDQREGETLIDLNRSGVALMEIVSEPDIRSPEEAVLYMRKLRSILRYLGTCDGNMEEGSCAATPTSRSARSGDTELGTRCEIKNVNSMRFVAKAIEYEAKRQVELLESRRQGGAGDPAVRRRTRARPARCAARRRRTTTATSPTRTCCRWCSTEDFIERPEGDPAGAAGREEGAVHGRVRPLGLRRRRAGGRARQPPTISRRWPRAGTASRRRNWVINELFGLLDQGRQGHRPQSPVTASQSRQAARPHGQTTPSRAASPRTSSPSCSRPAAIPRPIVEEKGLKQVTDTGAIEAIVDEVIAGNPGQVATYQKNPKVIGWFTGQVMKATGGKANPQVVGEILKAKLPPVE